MLQKQIQTTSFQCLILVVHASVAARALSIYSPPRDAHSHLSSHMAGQYT